MMKKLFYLMLSVVVLSACGGNDSDDPSTPDNPMVPGEPEKEVLTLDEHRFEMPADGGTFSVKVTGNVKCTVEIPEDFRPWLSEGTSKEADTHEFSVAANKELKAREGYVVFSGGSLRDTVYIIQYYWDESWLEMVYVQGGTFSMGATEEQQGEDDPWEEEYPVHQVTLSDYYIGKYEVTQGLWKAVMGENPSLYKYGDNYPVERVSWDDAQEFIVKLNKLTSKIYALPTEAQWEYAARGGKKSKGYKYSGSNDIDEVAWYWNNSSVDGTRMIHAVGEKKTNELGIYDMSGNVWEWCRNWWGDYSDKSQVDPVGPEEGSYRVLRGGGWSYNAWRCRVSFRDGDNPGYRSGDYGFRLVLVP